VDAQLNAARAWINTYYAQARIHVLTRLGRDAHAQGQAARARLSAGGGVDDAIAAEIEAARIEDRTANANAAAIAARAELRRWIGVEADEMLSTDAPVFVIDAGQLRHHLETHPALAAADADEAMAAADLRAARADRVPDWSWQAMYQHRDPAFGDMASIEVRIGLPLFQPWRQGPLIDARRADQASAAANRVAIEREHSATLESGLAEYAATEANLARARDTRVPLARQRAEAAASAFAAGTISSMQLIAARRDALEAELDLIDLEERLALVGASLTLQYSGDAP
jgi:outer membrane protein TolC